MTGLELTGTYYTQLVGLASSASSGVYSVLTNPIFLGLILVIVILSLVPGTND